MGLDVSVYTDIELIENEINTDIDYDEEFYDNCDFQAFVIDSDWDYKIKNIVNQGFYTGVKIIYNS